MSRGPEMDMGAKVGIALDGDLKWASDVDGAAHSLGLLAVIAYDEGRPQPDGTIVHHLEQPPVALILTVDRVEGQNDRFKSLKVEQYNPNGTLRDSLGVEVNTQSSDERPVLQIDVSMHRGFPDRQYPLNPTRALMHARAQITNSAQAFFEE